MVVYIEDVDGCSNNDVVLFEDSNTESTELYNNPKIIKIARIRPAINMDAPATCIGECFKISLLRNRTARAKPSAERIASISPKLIIDSNEDDVGVVTMAVAILNISTLLATLISRSLTKAKMNPMDPKKIPIMWNLLNRSFKNILAKMIMIIISIGPAISASFDAPILLIESYHANIPSERDKDAAISVLQDLIKRIVVSLYFFKIIVVTSNSIIPDNVMLTDESTIGENLIKCVVRYSIMIDSVDRATA